MELVPFEFFRKIADWMVDTTLIFLQKHRTDAKRTGVHLQLKGTHKIGGSEYRRTTEKSFCGLKSKLTLL
ncbi:unnamed protein product [Merluccius merluccius]